MECEAGQRDMLAQKFSRFRLRADVAVSPVEMKVYAAWGGAPAVGDAAIVAADPRLAEAGWRVLTADTLAADADFADWDRHRLALGLPDWDARPGNGQDRAAGSRVR
ncbi:MAG: hypothetical protein WDN04_28130 [Rhodospirillales bacterium]